MGSRAVPAIVVVSAVGLAVALALDAPPAVRAPLALWFLVACPGLAIVPLIGLRRPLQESMLVLALSVAIDIVVALAMMYMDLWSPPAIFGVLAAISVAASALQLRTAREEGA